jgi:hypothetical protein
MGAPSGRAARIDFKAARVLTAPLLAPVDAPQGVVTDGVAAVEVPDAVGAVVGGRHSVGLGLLGPAVAAGGPDAERAELVEREDTVREAVKDVFDPVKLGVTLGVRRFLPGLGALEGDTAAQEQPS